MSWFELWTAVAGTNPTEWVAFATGLACVALAAIGTIWNFPVAIVSCAFYVVVFHRAQLYSDRNLQFVFIAMSLYGWYEWLRGGKNHSALVVTRTPQREWPLLALAAAAYTGGFGYYLHQHTDASFPYLDSFTTAISLVAQYLLTRKRLENWLLWIGVDLIYVPMYWAKSLHATSGLYVLYLGLAAYGYWEWRRLMRQASIAELQPANSAAR
ncbi:nicotinamide riboside transporter PnuC [Solirubrum puertoriconensis]|uniref:Nicotinamide riboside transporter PnuC n=1 Tax=Solirubrum puertoriconensis TaxID=1751427 RepID=A0A9X0HIL8_SOLP1|nr:nicotinamide riboside transporter PnuC [Solirubrum puertoriconensis]KUG06569.1 hypothetical protein ASU33_04275 [Solirubrum puertoriconensis]